MRRVLPILAAVVVVFLMAAPFAEAGRGCCSWHGGQDYCDASTGRWVCNDGSYSPSCMCDGGGYSGRSIYKPAPVDYCSVSGLYQTYKTKPIIV